MNKITVYTNEMCPYCKQIKEELTKNNIEFKELSTSEDKNGYQAIVNLTGMGTVPTIKINDSYFVPGRDFGNPEQLLSAIDNYKDPTFSIETMIYEKIKTLNYNMYNAFKQIDNILKKLEIQTTNDR